MMTPVLWLDEDSAHAEAAQAELESSLPDCRFVHGRSAETAAGSLASQAWAVVVLCMPPAARDVAGPLALCAGHAVVMCLNPEQEALAARGFRCGLADYVLRAPRHSHLPELMQRLRGLLQRRQGDGSATRSVRTQPAPYAMGPLHYLQQQRQALQLTLGSMSQGIFKTGVDGRIQVYNQRVLELLNLPESLLTTQPTLAEVTQAQAARGDFGESYSLVDERGQAYVAQGAVAQSPALYWRATRDGRTLEVRTTAVHDGGVVRTFTDVSDYVRVEAELRKSEARFRSLSDLSSDWYWETDAQGRFVQLVGDLSINGITPADVLGRTRWDMGALNMTEADWAAHQGVLASCQPFRDLELQRRRPDGTLHWIAVSGVPLLDDAGQLRGYRGVGRDITQRKEVESQIERLAFYDALTGLPNRRLLLDRLQRSLMAVGRRPGHGALLFIDLDNFKDLNDTQGHDKGDQLLVQVAQRLQGCVRATDTVARFGGDEFVVLVEDLSSTAAQASAEAALVASYIITMLGKPYTIGVEGEGTHHSTPSIGIALFGPQQPCTVDELLKHADLAMYQAKAAGRNTQRFFDPDMQAAARARSALQADLRRGLQQQELQLHFQPVVDCNGKLQGAEALVRWSHPQRGMVAPAEFIEMAEQTGLILPLGQWVLEAACEQLVAWSRSSLTRALFLSVNVSVRQFRQTDFVDQLLEALHRTGANPERLKLELTESLLLTDVEDVIARMQQLRDRGVGFSLDDFGTGYSSLSYLKRLPLDQLKIDQGFVRDVLTDPNDAAIVRTILALANSLDLSVVAEGVETAGQLEFLKQHGCPAFQGYLFGRPMPVAVLEAALQPLSSTRS
ncbi:EAL domain-containing protein [Acidovorax sp. DW039]|uniref:putative bifunctional diguanylate cyclase/phosphodiesterase n=1 Tax=Acidovorax sp. DW039 TaxID=3095606 RepID=UPI0030D19087